MSLKQRIIDDIGANGPMPFERFMELALYDSEGFFGSDVLRSEKFGDFLTSPEVSSLFGETLARFVERVRDRIGDPFCVVEVAAGSGSLLRPLLAEIDVEAIAVESSPAARAVLSELVPVTEELPPSIRGVVIANELLDNLPMALAQRAGGQWRERWVGAEDDDLVFVDSEARPEVVEWLESYAGPVPDGGWVEVQLEARRWLADALSRLEAGAILIIDYGDTAENLLSRRQNGTLRTYRAHHLGPHPLDEPGQTDITADVNFTALLDIHPNVTLHRQDEFLTRLGLRERLFELRREELQAARLGDETARLRLRTLKTEAETLLHPRGLGDFRVFEVEKYPEPSV
ncbi:MAG TPA: SAM-dependent methyltransferase [Acidimicrobiia bacterium]|nr:SAM-dependent methyltransferase [Acidimicrobiia bacterium]